MTIPTPVEASEVMGLCVPAIGFGTRKIECGASAWIGA